MKIEDINSIISTLGTVANSARIGDFDQELSKALVSQNQKLSDDSKIGSVEEFRDRLTKYGSYAFLNILNAEKINEKIEQKRQELKELLGLNDTKNLSKDKIADLNKILEDSLDDYKKELLAKFQNNAILEKAQNINSKNNSSNFTLFDLISLI
ncbi:hypothetical protein CSPB12327_01045 [Campylobacter sp. RM12327]|uniref:hypothetical protein n=1 Tax=Campylobacter sputorum TaxID=206 RepID=UPI000B7940C6|nr:MULTISPECIES: hypothetical protein [Campylobacter]ASM40300.1 hypothetical protein CSPB_1095 [Campylobacter sputorum]MBE7357431.1 hypothetical protein [Campylobacter sp. RM11302]MBF6668741.1 hypothetical protein [Campylobacter sp. RM12327]MBF6674713.1 hypothetical protein [Campylobacter sp. RM13538]MBF6675970.1 hypothetical protein [Campylobacter sp. RM12321]